MLTTARAAAAAAASSSTRCGEPCRSAGGHLQVIKPSEELKKSETRL